MKLKYGFAMTILYTMVLAMSLSMPSLVLADEDGGKMYSVTITNISKGTIFTPTLVVTHKPGHPVFQLGEAASDELAAIAEAGDTQPLQDKILGSGMGYDAVSTGAPLPPGESVTVEVRAKGRFNHISLAAMLLPTNDGFFAINGMRLPKRARTQVIPGYDAGSETNDELFAHIPGPFGGEGLSPNDSGEGYVHIHNGIHGIGDMYASDRDWKNPVAIVKIMRNH
jgi:hypothetical protein